jgi:DNA repair protein RecN (Recombination protein N)
MLIGLSIRDVVLIDRLDIAFRTGLSVLTGETGAGKSILLDSLGLALGARAESGLVRKGASQLSVAAEFSLAETHPVRQILQENGIAADEATIILRRIVGADGRSRAFIDDQPVSIGLLHKIGEEVVEVHGQFESHGLLNPGSHLGVLDSFGMSGAELVACRGAHATWRSVAERLRVAEEELLRARQDEDLLRHAAEELVMLAPQPGEEADLAQNRSALMHGEKLLEAMNAAVSLLRHKGDVTATLRNAQKTLERVADKASGQLDPAIDALARAALDADEALTALERAARAVDLDPRQLEQAEERLFALRAAARKHNVTVEDLPRLKDRMVQQLAALDSGGDALAALAREERAAFSAYAQAARTLSKLRRQAAAKLDAAVALELPPLRLDRARFQTSIEELSEEDWGASGLDRVSFEVATNPGSAPGPIGKIASGGELARFMLALKVVLARVASAGTLVFDEVDSGIGGATAAAVGERLARLAEDLQVLVVTHSPQVAARGSNHLKVMKAERAGQTLTSIAELAPSERQEEIARMLAGSEITDHARAAAASLMGVL